MPRRSSRKSGYHLRHHSIDPLLTYDGIDKNPLAYIDDDLNSFLVLAELFNEHWKIDEENEKIYLDQVYQFTDDEEIALVKDRLHPLALFYQFVQNEQLSIHYSRISKKLTVVYPWNLLQREKRIQLNLFSFYHQCKSNVKSHRYFSRVFTFDEYQSICQRNDDEMTDAVNIIDYIYREIEASTMIINHQDEKILQIENFLRNDVITLKKHQIQSIDWMLKRENSTEDQSSTIVYSPYHRCHDLLDRIFHLHIIFGTPIDFSDGKFPSNDSCLSLSGGILCDEMGLGKTICVLLTSLLNPCSTTFLSLNIDPVDEYPPTKRIKLEQSDLLSCICGKIVRPAKRNSTNPSKTFFICHRCLRGIHKKCFLQIESLIDPFLCPYCDQRSAQNESLLSTKTTLIIAPAAIIHQWLEEIDKHLDCSLKVYMYEGVVNKFPIPSREYLAEQDFLFCSYENLKKDIHHNEICSTEHYSTRTLQRKYEYLVSPLLRLKFWRLVLDEAQMVDSPNTPTSKMARSLVAQHRWFVTGTPFHRSINDLEGIMQYLFPLNNTPREQIYSLLRNKEKIYHIFLSWLMNFLLSVSRRTSRKCLNDLPEQHERVIRLEFSQLERMYYNRIWQECRDDFKREFEYLWQKHQQKQNCENFSEWTFESTDDIDMNDIHFLSSTARSCLQTPLMKLRCLCDHPQVGAHGVRHNDPALVHYYNRFHYSSNQRFFVKRSTDLNTPMMNNDQPFTMKDLLDLLTARELESGEESLRLALLKYNGLASIYLIQHEHKQTRSTIENNNENYLQKAIETYEHVIELGQVFQKDFHVDSFQLAHSYYNLSFALSLIDKTVTPTFLSQWTEKDATNEFNQIKQRYQTQSINDMNQSWKNFNEKILSKKDLQNDVKELLSNLAEAIKPIENDSIEIFSYLNRDQTLPFRNWKGFLYHLVQEFDRLKEIRELLLLSVESLERQPADDQIGVMADCAKCGFDNDPKNLNSCIFCEIEPIMQRYNCSLQPELYSEKQIHDDQGTYLVYFINEILTKASTRSNDSLRQMGKLLRTDWNELLKKLRLENSSARSYAQQLKHLYLDLDEMLQCTSRLEFYIGDPQNRPRNKYNRFRFYPQTIDDERQDSQQEAKSFYQQAEKHRQQLHYFQEQQIDYYRSINNPDLLASDRTKCSMCHEYFGDDRPNVCFFLCGHFFCQQCTQRWKEHEIQQRAHRSHLKCPICRREIPIHSLAVLPWRNKDTTPVEKPALEHSQSDTNSTVSSRLRRLMDKQEHLTIQGHYGTKVDSIVSFIVELLNQDTSESNMTATSAMTTTTTCSTRPPLKILVFSQFTDILNVLATSLKLNSISHLQFTSTKILQQFRQDPNIIVLLMALGKGANGLNLTEAQHVILIEPQLHRSVEFQAIARVRRLGQQHETFVYRFIVNDTAEEVVLSNSRTAQTRLNHSFHENENQLNSENSSISTRAASFADDELLYEIDMARKIFYRPRISDDRPNTSLFDS